MGFMYRILLLLCGEQRITESCDGCDFVLLQKLAIHIEHALCGRVH